MTRPLPHVSIDMCQVDESSDDSDWGVSSDDEEVDDGEERLSFRRLQEFVLTKSDLETMEKSEQEHNHRLSMTCAVSITEPLVFDKETFTLDILESWKSSQS